MNPVILENLASPDIAKLREENGGMLILPMGATEQHGPHLPVGMDTLLVEKVCQAASAKTGVPVMSALRFTVSQGHTPKWPGTFSLCHGTFISTLRELAGWAEATGWKRLMLVNSHFGNDAAARVAVDQIRLEYLGKLQIGLKHVFQLDDEIWSAYTDDADDLHANRAETSLMLHLYPELVMMDRLSTSDDADRTRDTVFSYPVAQTSLNGVTGKPSDATAREGAELFERMTDRLSEILEIGKKETPPLDEAEWKNSMPERLV
ncbi:creatininase family protein [Luteolibacter sp. AS25]|uniref:creatininase family protein n=1 Tax=Luteolibacter sp. AS25 TaxID=3135776 RepID=UPI00398B929F